MEATNTRDLNEVAIILLRNQGVMTHEDSRSPAVVAITLGYLSVPPEVELQLGMPARPLTEV